MPRITDAMIMEKVAEYRTYSADELRCLGEEYDEPYLGEKIAQALLNNPTPFGALSHAISLLEAVALKALRYEMEAEADMERESYANAYLGRKAA